MTVNFLDEKEQIALKLEDMYSKFGFVKYKMNKFEEYSFYMENETFLSDNRVITFYGPNGKLLALKPDITMSIIKNCLKSQEENHKIYYNESVFRIPKGDDEFKEIHQIGIEYIGEIDTYQTLEVLNLAKRSLCEINPNFMLCISNMALILRFFDDLELNTLQKNQIINFMKQKNIHDLQKYLQSEKIDDSEIFTKLLTLDSDVYKGIKQLRSMFIGSKYVKEIREMENIITFLDEIVDCNRVFLDFSHISSTDYYNGLIFTGYLEGLAVPALTGGRYDKLVSKMGLEGKSALGFAVDLSAVDKLLSSQKAEILTVNYYEDSDLRSLISTSNKYFDEGKTFCISKID
ncbi:MAG: ATP phosphoribosyltransferase regulatory subunit [Clostridia bacterium]